MPDSAQRSRFRIPWPRFSLRLIFCVITAFAITLGYIVTQDQSRRAAAKRIERLGGAVGWEERGPAWLTRIVGRDLFARPQEIAFLNEPLADDDLASLSGLEDAERLIIGQNRTFTGSGLRHLASWPRLKWLYIYDAPVTDDGLASLPRIKTLQTIDVLATRITDESLPLIETFGYVQEISLGSATLSKQKVRELDRRMPKTKVSWSGQGYSE